MNIFTSFALSTLLALTGCSVAHEFGGSGRGKAGPSGGESAADRPTAAAPGDADGGTAGSTAGSAGSQEDAGVGDAGGSGAAPSLVAGEESGVDGSVGQTSTSDGNGDGAHATSDSDAAAAASSDSPLDAASALASVAQCKQSDKSACKPLVGRHLPLLTLSSLVHQLDEIKISRDIFAASRGCRGGDDAKCVQADQLSKNNIPVTHKFYFASILNIDVDKNDVVFAPSDNADLKQLKSEGKCRLFANAADSGHGALAHNAMLYVSMSHVYGVNCYDRGQNAACADISRAQDAYNKARANFTRAKVYQTCVVAKGALKPELKAKCAKSPVTFGTLGSAYFVKEWQNRAFSFHLNNGACQIQKHNDSCSYRDSDAAWLRWYAYGAAQNLVTGSEDYACYLP